MGLDDCRPNCRVLRQVSHVSARRDELCGLDSFQMQLWAKRLKTDTEAKQLPTHIIVKSYQGGGGERWRI